MRAVTACFVLQVLFVLSLPINDDEAQFEEDEDWVIDQGRVVEFVTNSDRATTHDALSERALGNGPVRAARLVLEKTGLTVRPVMRTSSFEPLTMGTRYNDMPSETVESQAICAETSSLPAFGYRFFLQHGDSATGQSHHGCRQSWHSMTPVSQTTPYQFTNSDVRAIIHGDIQTWWGRAVAMYNMGQHECAYFNLGRVLHVVQDSYSPGHVVRADTKSGRNCGDILTFQGYGAQNHDQHGAEDDWTKTPGSHGPYMCAGWASEQIAEQWFLCTTYLDLRKSSADPVLGKSFEQFVSAFDNPCHMYRPLPEGWHAPQILPISTTDLHSRLRRIFNFLDTVTDASGSSVSVGSMRAGSALDRFFKAPESSSYHPVEYSFTSNGVSQRRTLYMDQTPDPMYTEGREICGKTYRSIPSSIVHVTTQVAKGLVDYIFD